MSIYQTYSLSRRLRQTTDTLDIAIAADAIHGSILNPTGINTPAATGIPAKYINTSNNPVIVLIHR